MMMPLLDIKNISASYGEDLVLDLFSLELPESGCICFFGPSGCGKTTLFQVIAGLKKPDAGEVRTNETKNPKMSYVFQDDRLLPWLTSIENVTVVMHDKTDEERKTIATNILCQLGLSDALDKLPSELSGGMKQRVNIARAIAFDAEIMLLDEPFKGLDDEAKNLLKKIMLKLKSNKLLLLITHDRQDAHDLADRVVDMGKTR